MSLATPNCLYESLILQDAPVAYWGLDEANPLTDDSGNGRTLTAVGTPTNAASLLTYDAGGTADGSRTFNGTNQSYTAASMTVVTGSNLWSFECWFSTTTVTGTQTIFSSGAGDLQVRRNGTEIEAYSEGSAQIAITSGAGLAINTTYHVVIRSNYDNFALEIGSAASTYDCWINNVKQTFPDSFGVVTGGAWVPRIGSLTGGSEWFAGTIDEVAIYNYGLSPNQISQHYLAGTAGTWGTQFLGTSGTGKYPYYMLECAFGATYQWQGLSQQMFDVSSLCRNVSFFRGGDNAILNAPRAGTMSFDLLHRNGEFEDKSSATYYSPDASIGRSLAEPSKACRLRLWWPDTATPVYSMFYGYIESIHFKRRPASSDPFVSFVAADALKVFSLANAISGYTAIDEISSTRITNILSEITPFVGKRSFETGGTTVDGKTLTGSILSLIDETTFTEGGASMFFAAGDGTLKFFNKTHRSGGSNTATYGPSNYPFESVDPVHDDSDVYTTAIWTNTAAGLTTTQTDADYKLKNNNRIHSRETLHTTQGILDAAALAFVTRFKNSQKAIPSINPIPQAHSSPSAAWAVFMAHELSDKITVVDTTAGGLGTESLVQYIEGIGMQMSPGRVDCTLNISPYS